MSSKLVDAVTAILYETDLMGLAEMNCPPDEYRPEAEAIVAALEDGISTREKLRSLIDAVFADFFDVTYLREDALLDKSAEKIWALLKELC